ncbi:cadherin repeat domain-containing protein, partial [Limnoraphis robusta]
MTTPIKDIIAVYDNLPENTEDQYTAQEVNFPRKTFNHDFQVGEENNLIIQGFTNNQDQTYDLLSFVDQINIKRVNNNQVQGERQVIWFEQESRSENDLSLKPSLVSTMEETLLSDVINRGTDNIFANQGNPDGNINNIERVDLVSTNGLSSPEEFLDKIGFLVVERSGNDPFKIAAITAIDEQGNPTQFGTLQSISVDSWGQSSHSIRAEVMRKDSSQNNLVSSRILPNSQAIAGIFISYQDLNIADNQTFYGFSLFSQDIDENNDLVGLSDFPLNTPENDLQGNPIGSLDLISVGRIFIQKDIKIPPKITSDGEGEKADISIPENNTLVTDVNATDDRDSEGNGLAYSISGGEDEDLFTIDPITGELNFKQSPDFENPTDIDQNNIYQIEVTVTDSDGLTDVQTLNITVRDEVEETPVDDGEEETPVDDGEEETPVDDGEEETPVDDGDEETPVDDGEEETPV